MELTIEQALQQGGAAHKEGKLQEAERLYRVILQSQPLHPDANHNLGVLFLSVNKADTALPLFKTALEANPKIEQFWLSYIAALIKAKQVNSAKQVLDQAKKQGVAVEKLNVLKAQLCSIKEPENVNTFSPPQKQLSSLLQHYQTGRFSDAEKLATSIAQEFPSDNFSWKILAEVFKSTGRTPEAEFAGKKAIKVNPEDAEAHNNLGITLKKLGRLEEAKASYTRAIALKPDYAEAHSDIGSALQELGRLEEAKASYTRAIALKPDYALAHNNLGSALQKLGRLDEALASYTRAIALKPDYALAHSNLGNTLKELGRLDEAEASLRQAIALKPDFAEGHSNLGVTLHELGKLDEALASYTQALALKPDYALAHSNLGNTLHELGRFDEAQASFTQAIALKPDFVEAHYNLSNNLSYMNDLEKEICAWKKLLNLDADDFGLRASTNLAICNFLEGDFEESRKQVSAAEKIQEKTHSKFKNEKAYQRYLLKILKWHEDKHLDVDKGKSDKTLYVLGESHCLTSHHLRVQHSGFDFSCQANLIKGCKQWHLATASRNHFKNKFESIFCALPKHSYVLLAIGEIDCRLDEGIIKHMKKFPDKNIKDIIVTTVESYIAYIVKNNSSSQHNITVQGVPCPNIDIENNAEKDVMHLVEVIKTFNFELKIKAEEKRLGFLDVHSLTDRGDGFSNNLWHNDSHHISPEGMIEAWRRYTSAQSYE